MGFLEDRRAFLKLATIATAAAGSAMVGVPAFAQSQTDVRTQMFRTGKMTLFHIDLTPENTEKLRQKPRDYVPCKFKDETGKVYDNVGIHLRGGAGSFRPFDEKPGLTLNMDHYVDAQRFRGMDKFHLNNSVQDPSYLSELFCGEVCRSNGLPAAQVTHAVVVLNGKPRGLYVLKEGYDRVFLRRFFGDADGNFYNGAFLADIDQKLELLSSKADVKDQADLKALVESANIADHGKRFAEMEKLLDMEKFVTYLAMETMLWHWDGYAMSRNNYRIYHHPEKNKITFIPSGMDQMLGKADGPIFPEFKGMVARALVETPQGRRLYLQRIATALREVFHPDPMVKWLNFLQARVQPAVAYVDAQQGRDFPNTVNRLRDAVRDRAKFLTEQLKKVKA